MDLRIALHQDGNAPRQLDDFTDVAEAGAYDYGVEAVFLVVIVHWMN